MASLHERSLFRTLRPTVPGLSAVEVGLQALRPTRLAGATVARPTTACAPASCSCTIKTELFHSLKLQAAISQADIDAWVSGRPPTSLAPAAASSNAALPHLAEGPDLRIVKLFSLNDYLGLSTHPAVRRAAADAALECGNGA